MRIFNINRVRPAIIILTVICMLCMVTLSYAKVDNPMEDIPTNIPTDIRNEIKRLFSDIPKDRAGAIQVLGQKGQRAAQAVPYITTILHKALNAGGAENEKVALIAIDSLGKIGNPGAVSTIIPALKSGNKSLKKAAIISLGKIGDPKAVEPLIEILRDSFEIKVTMIALNSIGVSAVEPLIEALKDNDPNIRVNIATVLGILKDNRAVEPLIDLLKSNDILVQKSVLRALGALKDSRAVEPIIEKLKNTPKGVSDLAISALGAIGDKRAYDYLIEGLKSTEKSTRISTIRALGALKDSRAVGPLIDALDEADWNVQRYTTWALKNLTGENFGKDKAKWQKWHEDNKGK